MIIKTVKYKGQQLNCLKFKRIVGKDGALKADDIHIIMTNVELMKMCEELNSRFNNEQFLAVKVPKKKVEKKKAAPKPKQKRVPFNFL